MTEYTGINANDLDNFITTCFEKCGLNHEDAKITSDVLIESDKRGEDFGVNLTYSHSVGSKFFIPDNVYVIGTMNTADRSLALVDYALRRRFTFINLKPLFNQIKTISMC